MAVGHPDPAFKVPEVVLGGVGNDLLGGGALNFIWVSLSGRLDTAASSRRSVEDVAFASVIVSSASL